MHFRAGTAAAAITLACGLGIAALSTAQAQYYPPDHPPGAARGAPAPDGYYDDDVISSQPLPPQQLPYGLPDTYNRQNSYGRQGPAPYPYVPQPEAAVPVGPQDDDAIEPRPSFAPGGQDAIREEAMRPPASVGPGNSNAVPSTQPGQPRITNASLPPEDQPEEGTHELAPQFRHQLVDYPTKEPVGTIIIDTAHTFLYLVMEKGKAMRYGIGVGREGFTWSGTERISRMKEWPDWFPPKEMIERQPYLPRMMAGGDGNPLGARALYLGNTLYRIHGTNQPSTIGTYVSSGCIRLTNEEIEDLYSRVQVGTRVVVLPGKPPQAAQRQDASAERR